MCGKSGRSISGGHWLGFFDLSGSFVQIVLQKPALDAAVEEWKAPLRLEAHLFGKAGVSREYVPGVSLALLFEKVSDSFIRHFKLRDLTHALAVSGVHDDNTAFGQRRLREIAYIEFDKMVHTRCRSVFSSRLYRVGAYVRGDDPSRNTFSRFAFRLIT